MRVAVPAEVKNNEYRVAITPAGVHELARHGHEVVVEARRGRRVAHPGRRLRRRRRPIVPDADDVWGEGELVLKVKEPIAEEYHRMRRGPGAVHLPAPRRDPRACTEALLAAGHRPRSRTRRCRLPDGVAAAARADVRGRRPAGAAGRRAPPDARGGGRGVLMGGVVGRARRRKVVVLGAGVSGMNAAAIALGMQAEVPLLDSNIAKLRAGRRDLPGPPADGRVQRLRDRARAVSTPTWSSARCWCPGPRPRSWSPTSWSRG